MHTLTYNKKTFYVTLALISICLSALIHSGVSAVNASSFNAGRIIDDSIFTNSNAMSSVDIQNFLNSKVPTCDTWGTIGPYYDRYGTRWNNRADYSASQGINTPFTCLKDFSENGRTAAQIIFDASRDYSINPQVLIVLLQKEQGLVTDDWPWYTQYRTATGYGCPDSGPNNSANCSSNYYGFINQVNWSARMFHAIMTDSPTWYKPYLLGNNYIQYDTDTNCGGSTVNIQNRATQSLYNYTPYQPTQAALNAGYGTAEPCGAYGNRNFWLYFNDWFGTTYSNDTLSSHPSGTLIVLDGVVYYIGNGAKHWVKNSSIYLSNSWSWGWLKSATTGDRNLPISSPIDYIKPGMLYRSENSGVYISVIENGAFVKQLVSYDAFIRLGYKWNQIRIFPENELPAATSPTVLTNFDRHPDGTLVIVNNAVYMIDHSTLRHVSPSVFVSNNWNWNDVVQGAPGDTSLTLGARMLLRAGAPVRDDNGYYIVNVPPSGYEAKSPIGPWSCYEDVLRYSAKDAQFLSPADIPPTSGSRISC